jgi:hypothetical protein
MASTNKRRTKARPPRVKKITADQERVLLHPENNDLFMRTGKQVIEDCQLGISVQVWFRELEAMLHEVGKWIDAPGGGGSRVRACYCTPRGTKIILFFVPKSDQFDFDLADALTELNVQLMTRFNVGMVEVRQVPHDEVERFVTIDRAKVVYGQSAGSHRAVEA